MDKDMMELMLECIPGLLCIDTEGKITYVNDKMLKFRGCTREEMLSRHITEFFPYTKMMESLENRMEKRLALYQGKEAFSVDKVEASLHYLLEKDGNVLGLMTYDLFQDLAELEQFLQIYIDLDDAIKYYRNELKQYRNTKYSIDDIIGVSPAITKVKTEIRNAAATNSTVLITGETGTGKELIAHSIHNLSKRCMNSFVKLSITNLPDSLVESELFGYESGSFTGAGKSGKPGRFEAADNGTLFIDEIETLPANIQPKLLRVLQEKEIDKIGRNESIPVDVRIISATNVDLEQMVMENKFRKDLYYRLEVIKINMPPLRERKEDIPYLVKHYIEKYNLMLGTSITGISQDSIKKMQLYDWPGNVRELKNVIERAMSNTLSGEITADALEFSRFLRPDPVAGKTFEFGKADNPIEDVKRKAEAELIRQALDAAGGNKTKAAELLNISRPLLYQKMARLSIVE